MRYILEVEWIGKKPSKKKIAAIDAHVRESDHKFPGLETGFSWSVDDDENAVQMLLQIIGDNGFNARCKLQRDSSDAYEFGPFAQWEYGGKDGCIVAHAMHTVLNLNDEDLEKIVNAGIVERAERHKFKSKPIVDEADVNSLQGWAKIIRGE